MFCLHSCDNPSNAPEYLQTTDTINNTYCWSYSANFLPHQRTLERPLITYCSYGLMALGTMAALIDDCSGQKSLMRESQMGEIFETEKAHKKTKQYHYVPVFRLLFIVSHPSVQ